jgi:hypothetical protein
MDARLNVSLIGNEILNVKLAMEVMWRREEVLLKQVEESQAKIIAMITEYFDGTSVNKKEETST